MKDLYRYVCIEPFMSQCLKYPAYHRTLKFSLFDFGTKSSRDLAINICTQGRSLLADVLIFLFTRQNKFLDAEVT